MNRALLSLLHTLLVSIIVLPSCTSKKKNYQYTEFLQSAHNLSHKKTDPKQFLSDYDQRIPDQSSAPEQSINHLSNREIKTEKQEPIDVNALTIIIHGTTMLDNLAKPIKPLHEFLSREMRSPHGLIKASSLTPKYRFYRLAYCLAQQHPLEFPFDHIYFFGWSGYLTNQSRLHAAQELAHRLNQLRNNPLYKRSPITLITHSHGGNVVLELAGEYHAQRQHVPLIDRLILLACPVQDRTETYINSGLFKKIYNIYGPADLIQVMDPQGLHSPKRHPISLFSRRSFTPTAHLLQAKIRWDSGPCSHIDFITPAFIGLLPDVLIALDMLHAQYPEHQGVYSLVVPAKKNVTA